MPLNDPIFVIQTSFSVLVDKPAQWLTIPGRDPKDKRPVLSEWLSKNLLKKVYPIHRLDAEVSGLILFGLSPDFHKEANLLFENRRIHKTYQAFTGTSQPPLTEQNPVEWRSLLLRGKKRTYESPHGKESLTRAWIERSTPYFTEWRLQPITGRSHQLRYELAHRKLPILGDTLYGSTSLWPQGGIALRAIQLDLPEDFAKKWEIPQSSKVPLLPTPLPPSQ